MLMPTAFAFTGPKEFQSLWSCLGHWRVSIILIVQVFTLDKFLSCCVVVLCSLL